MANILGIDLGTTYCVMSTCDDTGSIQLVPNKDGETLTPSVIDLSNLEKPIVGKSAQKFIGKKPNIINRFKRNMNDENKNYDINGKTFTPTELTTILLKYLSDSAETALGDISEVTITVPATFTDLGRKNTRQAAEDAGLNVKYIINEPTAAAIYYNFENLIQNEGKYAIFDLGGGTFDVSIADFKDFDLSIISSDGSHKLGGLDFDDELKNIAWTKYKNFTGKEMKNVQGFLAEQKKKELTDYDETIFDEVQDADVTVTRKAFEESIAKYIAQIKMLCEKVMNDIKIKPERIDGVVLAGGSTRMPIIKKVAKEIFKTDPIITGNPDVSISMGAAFYCLYKADQGGKIKLSAAQEKKVANTNISDVANYFYGTRVLAADVLQSNPFNPEKENFIIVKKNTKLPFSKTEPVYTSVPNQRGLRCTVTESKLDTKDLKYVNIIAEDELELPPGLEYGSQVDVTYTATEDGMMKCSYKCLESGKTKTIDVNISAQTTKTKVTDSDIDQFEID